MQRMGGLYDLAKHITKKKKKLIDYTYAKIKVVWNEISSLQSKGQCFHLSSKYRFALMVIIVMPSVIFSNLVVKEKGEGEDQGLKAELGGGMLTTFFLLKGGAC